VLDTKDVGGRKEISFLPHYTLILKEFVINRLVQPALLEKIELPGGWNCKLELKFEILPENTEHIQKESDAFT
jgi:hypothetical protein